MTPNCITLQSSANPRIAASGAGGLKGIISRSTSRWKTARSWRPLRLSSAPTPRKVLQGRGQGCKRSPTETERALRLDQALDESQRKKAIFAEKAPADIRAANTLQPPTDAAVGITFAELNDDQKARLQSIVESYAADMPLEVAKAWLDEIVRAGTDSVRFTWAGPADRTQGHAYRVQGRPS